MDKKEKLKIIEEFELTHGFTYMSGLYDFFEKVFELGKDEGIGIGKNLKIDELLKVNSPTTREGMVCLKHKGYMLNYCGACYYEDTEQSKFEGRKEALEEAENFRCDYCTPFTCEKRIYHIEMMRKALSERVDEK